LFTSRAQHGQAKPGRRKVDKQVAVDGHCQRERRETKKQYHAFPPEKTTVDAIHAPRFLPAKHREKQRPIHPLDSKKAFVRSPLIWRTPSLCITSTTNCCFIDTITRNLQKPALWTLPYADDVMLTRKDKSESDQQVKKAWYLTTDPSEPGSTKAMVLSSHGQQQSSTLDRQLPVTAAWGF
uniref:Reverse transcriptase domain-containing protein n=1 Tax=Haemonchus placei TaxID=6290 RepID=A0A0N4X3L2_HAEPC